MTFFFDCSHVTPTLRQRCRWMRCLLLASTVAATKSFSIPLFFWDKQNACFAKPSPSSNCKFDLDNIEAFELEQAALEDQSLQKCSEFDDEDISETFDEGLVSRTFTVPPELDKKRIDSALSHLDAAYSRSFCGKLVSEGKVFLLKGEMREKLDRKSFKVQTGQELEVQVPHIGHAQEIAMQDLPLDIIYEDSHIIVINKAANMVVHPAAGHWDGTVVNAVAYHLWMSPHGSGDFVDSKGRIVFSEDENVDRRDREKIAYRPGIIHRLDKGTTGVLVVAKTRRALAKLSDDFAARQVKKTYLTVTVGKDRKSVV